MSEKFPPEIRQKIGDKALVDVQIGLSGAHVYQVADAGLYLKTQPVAAQLSFSHDVHILEWLYTRLPVPKVVAFEQTAEEEYLLLTEVAGKNCVDAMARLDHIKIIRLLAEGLHQFHDLDITDCPLHEKIDDKLEYAEHNVSHDLVDEDDFDQEQQGKTAQEILDFLQNEHPPEDDLVFNHGDYCLPNILLQGNQISGFVDLSRAGISDRYNDLAIASRSIRYNLGEQYEKLFFEMYGVKDIDEEKINYYRTMDELF